MTPPSTRCSILFMFATLACALTVTLAAKGDLTAAPSAPTTPVAVSSPAASASLSPVDEKTLERAKSWYQMLQSGTIDRSQLTKDMNDALTPDKVSQISSQLKQLGSPTSFTQDDTSTVQAYTVYHYDVVVTGGTLIMTFALDQSGKVAGLNLRPASGKP